MARELSAANDITESEAKTEIENMLQKGPRRGKAAESVEGESEAAA